MMQVQTCHVLVNICTRILLKKKIDTNFDQHNITSIFNQNVSMHIFIVYKLGNDSGYCAKFLSISTAFISIILLHWLFRPWSEN